MNNKLDDLPVLTEVARPESVTLATGTHDVIDLRLDTDPGGYDPYNNTPPMPLDDPVSHELMECVYCKRGWPHWHRNGDRIDLENPAWREALADYLRAR